MPRLSEVKKRFAEEGRPEGKKYQCEPEDGDFYESFDEAIWFDEGPVSEAECLRFIGRFEMEADSRIAVQDLLHDEGQVDAFRELEKQLIHRGWAVYNSDSRFLAWSPERAPFPEEED